MPRSVATRAETSSDADPALPPVFPGASPRTRERKIAAPSLIAKQPADERKFRVLPPRLARYTLPDFTAINRAAMEGTSLKRLWRDYAASAPAPLRYVAFTRRLKRWKADPQPPVGQTGDAPAGQAAPQAPSRGKKPKALTHCFTLPDFNEIDREIMRGASIKAEWQKYSSTTNDPLSYSAFQKNLRQYVADKRSIAEIAPGIPGYMPDENTGAEKILGGSRGP